jgi:hypothetical protein
MTTNKARKAAARERANERGRSYTTALREVTESVTGPSVEQLLDLWQRASRQVSDAIEDGEHPDPYALAAALDTRGGLFSALGLRVRDASGPLAELLGLACSYAAILDQESAARTRYGHHIPTLRPGAELAQLHLEEMRCQACGRPWRADPDPDACPHCPCLLWGSSPTSRAEAATLPAPRPARLDGVGDAVEAGDGGQRDQPERRNLAADDRPHTRTLTTSPAGGEPQLGPQELRDLFGPDTEGWGQIGVRVTREGNRFRVWHGQELIGVIEPSAEFTGLRVYQAVLTLDAAGEPARSVPFPAGFVPPHPVQARDGERRRWMPADPD